MAPDLVKLTPFSSTTQEPYNPSNAGRILLRERSCGASDRMAAVDEPKTLTATPEVNEKVPDKSPDPVKVNVIRLPTEDIEDIKPSILQESRTTLHIYSSHERGHKLITPSISRPQERRWGPKPQEQKARRLAKKAAKNARLLQVPQDSLQSQPLSNSDGGAYFLHTPYLSFHVPPSVLYTGSSRYAPAMPIALVHTGCFWRSYKIQIGPSLSQPGVIDPRGVVSWRHNGGSSAVLQNDKRNGDGRLLKGYKVRGWRLWGETGKAYVHGIRERRRAGAPFDDPDVDAVGQGEEEGLAADKVCADEVVHLTWTYPLSRHTRRYTFYFRRVEFQWKGTGTVSEGRTCGWMLRFCHLKLVARIPIDAHAEKGEGVGEVCLGKYTSSIAAEKSGTLEVFDCAVLRFVERYMPSLLEREVSDKEKGEDINGELEENKIAMLKKGVLYQLIVATVLCMVNAEKEKRHTLIDLILGAGENAGSGG